MEPRKPRERPERLIQDKLIAFLEKRGWYVKETHGNAFQSGFPDLYAVHPLYGQRWIEVKNPGKYQFTDAQIETFTKWASCSIKVWVLTAATEDEYKKLFAQANWHHYLPVNKVISRPRPKHYE